MNLIIICYYLLRLFKRNKRLSRYNQRISSMECSQSSDSDDMGFQNQFQINGNRNIDQNKTAYSLNIDLNEIDNGMNQFSHYLIQFYQQKLKRDLSFKKFDNFQRQSIFPENTEAIQPFPHLYFLPYTILIRQTKKNLMEFRDSIHNLNYPHLVSSTPNYQQKTIHIKIHSQMELVYYRVKTIQCQILKNHKIVHCMDRDLIIDKLFEFYANVYKEFYMQEVIGLILYWAYQKDILSDQYINERAWKMIVIALYILSGFNIVNVMGTDQYQEINKKRLQRMMKLSYVDKKNECQLSEELFDNTNYSLRTHKSFYNVQHRKSMYLKRIYPVLFPLEEQQVRKYRQKQEKKIKAYLKSNQNYKKISVGSIFVKIFKYLYDDFQKSEKITIDFKGKRVFQAEKYQRFALEVLDPVFGDDLTKQFSVSETSTKKVMNKIKEVYQTIKEGQPQQTMKKLLSSLKS